MNVHRRKEYRPGPRPGSGGVICSYGEPPPAVATTLAAGQQPACGPAASGGSSMLFHGVERAPRALRLFGREIVDSGASGEARDNRQGQYYDGRNGDDDDHGGQGDEEGELDLELRLGAAGQY